MVSSVMKALVLGLGLLVFYFAAVSALETLEGGWPWVRRIGGPV